MVKSAIKASRPYQNRTAIIYFGPTKQEYLKLVKAESHRPYLDDAQPFLKEQLLLEMHNDGCNDSSCYTIHSQRMRSLQGWLGEKEEIPSVVFTAVAVERYFPFYPALSCVTVDRIQITWESYWK